jgi:hypothetical protein
MSVDLFPRLGKGSASEIPPRRTRLQASDTSVSVTCEFRYAARLGDYPALSGTSERVSEALFPGTARGPTLTVGRAEQGSSQGRP